MLAINKHTGKIEARPEIISRGFISMSEVPELLDSARQVVHRTLEKSSPEEMGDWGVVKDKIRAALRRHMDKETGKNPLILPVILEV